MTNSQEPLEGEILPGAPLTELDISHRATVQPNLLLRTSVFVPGSRHSASALVRVEDLSDDLRSLEFARVEGYTQVVLKGPRLSVDTDFKIWRGIVWLLNKHGYTTEEVQESFTKFAQMCGFPSKRLDKALRERIFDSLERIRQQSLSFAKGSRGDGGALTGLVLKASFDWETDLVVIRPDPDLWELYRLDHQVLLNQRAFDPLKRQEVAQCLFMFIESLPNNTGPIAFSRLKQRLQLTAPNKEANRAIRRAITRLQEIGYLRADIVDRKEDSYLFIEAKSMKLTLKPGTFNDPD